MADDLLKTMRALMLTAERKLQVVELPVPLPKEDGEVLVRVRAVGVCGSDLHGYLGHTGRRIPPLVMGHEAAGEVVAVGPGVEHLVPGSRVATNTVASCGHCGQCVTGNRSLCDRRRILGMNAPGAYAEYFVWLETSLLELPNRLSFELAALAEPLAIALHAVGIASLRVQDAVFIARLWDHRVLVLVLARLSGAGRSLSATSATIGFTSRDSSVPM